MSVAALITWLVTAVGGFVLLGTWLARGGARRDAAAPPSRFAPGLIFGHFLLAVIALVLWIIYLVADSDGLAWVSFALVVIVALLGFTMFFRWLPQARSRAGRTEATPEQHFPVAVVVAHGLFAAATLVLVLLAAITA